MTLRNNMQADHTAVFSEKEFAEPMVYAHGTDEERTVNVIPWGLFDRENRAVIRNHFSVVVSTRADIGIPDPTVGTRCQLKGRTARITRVGEPRAGRIELHLSAAPPPQEPQPA